ncbi:MAG: glycosyltransferase family 2 protein [Firmicutes bacterium]|nr:glycosyltransferase family 2 protein [Bacillota bacterium]
MAEQRLSVAMCTYNGARFLAEQLGSIAAQTRRPDELVVCDDGSFDSTAEVIEAFKSTADFPVYWRVNQKKLGSTKNFARAIALCTGDIIALSDQDDVWRPEKLMLIEEQFRRSPGAGLVFTDAEVTDESLRPLGYRLWQYNGFGRSEQKKINRGQAARVLLKRNVVTGATMAFKAEFRPLFMPIPGNWVHDGWIALIIAACADLAVVNWPLIQYRQHFNQQIGASKIGPVKQLALARRTSSINYGNQLSQYRTARDRLRVKTGFGPDEQAMSELNLKIAHLKARCNMPEQKLARLPAVLKELITFRYHRYASGWKSAAKDLFLS